MKGDCLVAFENIDLKDEDLSVAVETYNRNLPKGQTSLKVENIAFLTGSWCWNWNNIDLAFKISKCNGSIKTEFEDLFSVQVMILDYQFVFVKY